MPFTAVERLEVGPQHFYDTAPLPAPFAGLNKNLFSFISCKHGDVKEKEGYFNIGAKEAES